MALSDIRREHVLQAIRECDQRGRDEFLDHYGFGRARDYELIHERRSYDPKAMIGVAHQFAVPSQGILRSDQFTQGPAVRRRLEELGFEVRKRADAEVRPLLGKIADLLETRSLTDPDIRRDSEWRNKVKPITRPFLDLVKERLNRPDASFYTGGDVTAKRESYDRLKISGDLSPFVAIGLADDAAGDLERQLLWGLYHWGAQAKVDAAAEALGKLQPNGFQLRLIDGSAALGYSGATAVLFQSRSPDELRGADEDDLVAEVVGDLSKLADAVGDAMTEPPRVWIEKTIVRGRPDRENGEFALGRALWSPQRSKRGTDIYRYMREVSAGDIVLHLTDNEGFTGMSRALSPVEEFQGVKDTDWGVGDSYLVRLHRYEQLQPVLPRDVFFGAPFGDRLVALLDAGMKNLFYTREPSLNQGAYLTPAPPQLIDILNEAYRTIAGRALLETSEPPAKRSGEVGHTLLVGAVSGEVGQEAQELLEAIRSAGRHTHWWSFPLSKDAQQALAEWPYLYWYSGAQLTHRLHIADYRTHPGSQGIVSPWPEYTMDQLRNKTRAGDRASEIFKTWFLLDAIEPLTPAIGIDDLEKLDGSAANKFALEDGFALWRLRSSREDRMKDLADLTNTPVSELEEIATLLTKKKQLIIEGPPGSGKTFVAEKLARYFTGNPLTGSSDERLLIIQFHQSYGYEDFMQGIRPETNEAGQLEYHVRPGSFKYLCGVAEKHPGRDFVILIDEINRGNISRIFGELLLLLEYRDMAIPLAYSRPQEGAFRIPDNVYLIGTMNTTDRSLAQIDYALRRRFYFHRMMPVIGNSAPVLSAWLSKQSMSPPRRNRVLRLFVALNLRVQAELGEHHQVGHSYFMDAEIGTPDGEKRVWTHSVLPLLEEYFYNKRDRLQLLAEFDPERLLRSETVEETDEE